MWEHLQSKAGPTVLGLVDLAGLTLVLVRLVKKFRDQNAKGQQTLDELLGNFSEMERRGDIRPEEYRKITAVGEPDGSKCQDDLHTRNRSDAQERFLSSPLIANTTN